MVYGRFDSKIRFENESDGRFDSRFDSNEKKTIRRSLLESRNTSYNTLRYIEIERNFLFLLVLLVQCRGDTDVSHVCAYDSERRTKTRAMLSQGNRAMPLDPYVSNKINRDGRTHKRMNER